ncbi:MAG: purine-nucleoside phosphorylase [Desulfurobacteriaceae bacterium]
MKAAEFIKKVSGFENFDIAVVGGSGIELEGTRIEIPYEQIPSMPKVTVPGHKGTLKICEGILFFEGRFHYYEGKSDEEMRFIPELCKALGVEIFIPTCASGAISRRASRNDVGVIVDHINLLGRNPLVGLIEKYGSKVFVNGKKFYDDHISNLFLQKGLELGIKITPVILASCLGPNYETFAEIRFLEIIGADVVSMSTVPEVIVANFLGMKVAALTIITNDALNVETSHKEVVKRSKEVSQMVSSLLKEVIRTLKEEIRGKFG